jgi:spore maturation protein B
MSYTDFIIPIIISLIVGYGLIKGVNVFEEFIVGAKEGLAVVISIFPALVALMTVVAMLNISGVIDFISYILSPITSALGIPKEIVPLGLLRPISGSGSLAIFENTLTKYGADSFIGRVASVLQGSTETTFYTIAVYFGANQIDKTRHSLFCALIADLTSLILSGVLVRLFF